MIKNTSTPRCACCVVQIQVYAWASKTGEGRFPFYSRIRGTSSPKLWTSTQFCFAFCPCYLRECTIIVLMCIFISVSYAIISEFACHRLPPFVTSPGSVSPVNIPWRRPWVYLYTYVWYEHTTCRGSESMRKVYSRYETRSIGGNLMDHHVTFCHMRQMVDGEGAEQWKFETLWLSIPIKSPAGMRE